MDKIRRLLVFLSGKSKCKSIQRSAVVVIRKRHNIAHDIMIGGVNNPTCNCIENAKKLGYVFKDDGKTCPRYLLGAKSGEMLELCTAQHAEQSAIKNTQRFYGLDLSKAEMYMTCECPCADCATAIVESGIKTIYIIDKPDYDPKGREILLAGGVHIETW